MAATILTVNELEKRYITETIFAGVTFQVNEGERVGVVGPNGVGKSTLLQIIAGLETPSGGEVVAARGLRVVYLPQEARFESDRTVREEAHAAFAPLLALRERMTALEHALGTADDDATLTRLMEEYDAASLAFETGGGYDIEHRTDAVLHGLGFDEGNWDMAVTTASGGQKTRVALAKALLESPDLLLLDEPTNHLDLAALEWLENFLASWRGTYLVVSHDRYFLDRVTGRTLDLAYGRLEDYPAGYSRYLTLREERLTRRQKEYEAQQEFIAKTEEFIRRFKAGQRSREARGRATRLARLERLERPREPEKLKLAINANLRSGRVVLATDELRVGYVNGEREAQLLATPELEVESGDRVALIGPNGGGKTTFLRTILGEIPTLAGRFRFGTNVRPAYYAQGHEGLRFDRTVLETILDAYPLGEEAARTLLGRFLFAEDDVFKSVGVLSGGERSRLALARLTLARANFLILDEPTNHLDIAAREALEGVLDEYAGTLLFVSHDRYFIDRLATQVWAIGADGALRTYLGNYSDYLRKAGQPAAEAAEAAPPPAERPKPAPPPARAAAPAGNGQTPAPVADGHEERRARGGEERRRRERRKQLVEAEKQIGAWEERLNQLSADMAAAGAAGRVPDLAPLSEEYERLHDQLESLYARWSRLTAEVDEFAAAGAGER
ncbi:MAG TPA: ABC-F family ATP-binding cassette domain-containing protein [Thermomicrobiales bacterium]|nr:ABC-F family ATP-binding cassette domain-containing protein [Thermomicrobiales bacterium]